MLLHIRARRMRRHPTEGERRAMLYLDRLGVRYKAQVIIYPYIVDFLLPCGRILEIDGSTHWGSTAYDDARSYYLAKRGHDVYRLTNWDVTPESIKGILTPHDI